MTKGMIYNSRLMPPELDKWFEMCATAGVEVSQALRKDIEAFALLDDVLFYVTTIEDAPVGGVALFRDRKRLGMMIASVTLSPDFRDRLIRSLIKSSLPFFRTAAIRDIDALVIPEGVSLPGPVPPFPYSFLLPAWVRPTLEELDFSSVEKIVYGIIQSPLATHDKSIEWDNSIDPEVIRDFVWEQRHLTGLDSSCVWLSLAVGLRKGSVRSITIDDELCLVIGYSIWEKTLLIGPLVWDSDRVEDTFVAAAVIELAQELGISEIHLTLRERKRTLLDLLTTKPLSQEISLYRKLL
ncbi:MAG: hypothetical protein K9W43_07210 [Candidatus Thorarchaeota archaeon]|nr:hypothetical protein [Candidatus Thorarchaeota archaeon]